MYSENESLVVAVSGVRDGSMSVGVTDDVRLKNRTSLLHRLGLAPEQSVLVHLNYEGNDYRRYFTVSSQVAGDGIITPSSIVADALFTTDKNLALLLPVADCIGAVLYDSASGALGLVHLGRHNLVQQGGLHAVQYMIESFGSAAHELDVYLGPGAGREHYPLYDFNNRSLLEVAQEQLLQAGVSPQNIRVDSRDTTLDAGLFSHSEFIKGNRPIDGRQAIVTAMRP